MTFVCTSHIIYVFSIYLLLWGHTQHCSLISPCFVLMDLYWWYSGAIYGTEDGIQINHMQAKFSIHYNIFSGSTGYFSSKNITYFEVLKNNSLQQKCLSCHFWLIIIQSIISNSILVITYTFSCLTKLIFNNNNYYYRKY